MQEITEAQIETSAIDALQALGWDYQHGLAIAPEAEKSERESFEQVLLLPRLRHAIARLNLSIPEEAQEQALRTIQRINSPELITNNEQFQEICEIRPILGIVHLQAKPLTMWKTQ